MVNEYKKIVLLKGLEAMNDYHFRLIKSLLVKALSLTKKMQDDYDRIRIADLLEKKYQRDAGLSNLIALCKDTPALGELAETLKKQRLKVKKKSKKGKKSTMKRGKKDKPSPALSISMTNTDLEPESDKKTPLLKELKIKISEDPKRMQLPQEQSQSLEPSATTKQQMQGCVQAPLTPLPMPSSSSPIKQPRLRKSPSLVKKQEKTSFQKKQELEDTITKIHDKMKVQESQGQRQLPEQSVEAHKQLYVPHSSDASNKTVWQNPYSALSPTSSCRIQTPQVPPATPSTRLQTPQDDSNFIH